MVSNEIFNIIEKACENIEQNDNQIKSFLPEKNRKERLIQEAKTLIANNNIENLPLLGLLIGVKDLFSVENLDMRCGSNLPYEAFNDILESKVVNTLKKEGALVLGKTVTTEFAYFEQNETKNPINLEHTPGGSSSGSAAAVASDFVPFAFGTQTIGSISRPASFCGVIGFKPTYGRVSAEGVFPFSPTMDHVGSITSDFNTIYKTAPYWIENWNADIDIIDKLIKKCPIFAIPEGKYLEQADKSTLEIFYNTVETIESFGIKVVKFEYFNDILEINSIHKKIVSYEFAKIHNNYKNYHNLYRAKSIELINEGDSISENDYKTLLEKHRFLSNSINIFMEKNSIDFWISPSTVSEAPLWKDGTGSPIMNLPWTHFGLPTISIPITEKFNLLPFGLQIAGKRNFDELLVAISERVSKII
ncbi:amidase [bacterium]|nr:amidase [bacterium]